MNRAKDKLLLRSSIIHRTKFRLWNFSRLHTTLGVPIRYVGKLSTKGVIKKHKSRMRKMGRSLLPKDRYERSIEVPTQFLVLYGERTCEAARKGIQILLNHLRIPYRKIDRSYLVSRDFGEPVVLIVLGFPWQELEHIASLCSRGTLRVIAFGSSGSYPKDMSKFKVITADPANLLPYNEGLRSNLTCSFVNSLLELSSFPIITGLLPPQIALRIDDVVGYKLQYLDAALDHGWVPNLGLFVEDFQPFASRIAPKFSSLAKSQMVELSPHALTANSFLFFDYNRGKPFRFGEFSDRWVKTLRDFRAWGFPLSSVINAHFHTLSSICISSLLDCGVRYHFSELQPDWVSMKPDVNHLPCGDPVCTTGQSNQLGIFQVYSGDSALDCNWSTSLYDFMMHVNSKDLISSISQRIYKRLDLSLWTGFAAFITTHENLLSNLRKFSILAIWDEVDRLMADHPLCPQKTSLSELGRACENHTNIVVDRVEPVDNEWVVRVSGNSFGESFLTAFLEGRPHLIRLPAFKGKRDIVVRL